MVYRKVCTLNFRNVCFRGYDTFLVRNCAVEFQILILCGSMKQRVYYWKLPEKFWIL